MVEQRIRTSSPSMGWVPREDVSRLNLVPPSWLKVETSREMHDSGSIGAVSVLFVCTGNICRSAFAACALQKMVRGDHISVGSAGIGALVGDPIDPVVANFADQLEIQTDNHVSRQLTGRQLKNVDLVLIFGPEHYQWILENHPDQIRKVFPLQRFVATAELISMSEKLTWNKLIEKVNYRSRKFTEDDWIEDPYRRSKATYLEVVSCIWGSVQRMSVLLNNLVPREI